MKLTAGNNGAIIMTTRAANISRMLAVCISAHFILPVTCEAGAAVTRLQMRQQMQRGEVSCLRPLSWETMGPGGKLGAVGLLWGPASPPRRPLLLSHLSDGLGVLGTPQMPGRREQGGSLVHVRTNAGATRESVSP